MLGYFFKIAAHFSLFVMRIRWNAFLARNADTLRNADAVVVMSSPRAFGTLYATLDDARRMFAGKKLVFIYHLERVGQNPLLNLAVPDATVLALPRKRLDLKVFGRELELPPDDWHDPMSYFLTEKWIAGHGKPNAEVLNAFMLWRRLPVSKEAENSLPRVTQMPTEVRPAPYKDYAKVQTAYAIGEFHVLNELHMYGGWNTLRAQQPVAPLSLPEEIRKDILAALTKARGGRPAKLCGFHTRFGGLDDKVHRDGSPVEFYIPAIRKLVAAGYQVLMQGDRGFHPRFRDVFDGMVVDAELLGVDKNAFRLFCGCHTDLFLGDWPVAPQMAASNGIPTLVVNAWPVGWGVNGCQVYYRGIEGKDGQRWDAKRTLRQGPLISCNTEPHAFPELYGNDEALFEELTHCSQIPIEEEEISEAVSAFLEDISSNADMNTAQKKAATLFPDWSPISMATNCRVNRAWLARYAPNLQ